MNTAKERQEGPAVKHEPVIAWVETPANCGKCEYRDKKRGKCPFKQCKYKAYR